MPFSELRWNGLAAAFTNIMEPNWDRGKPIRKDNLKRFLKLFADSLLFCSDCATSYVFFGEIGHLFKSTTMGKERMFDKFVRLRLGESASILQANDKRHAAIGYFRWVRKFLLINTNRVDKPFSEAI
jgi:hypothetical protein